jgi:hypothetical protein
VHSETATAFRFCGEQTVRTIAGTHNALLEYYAATPNVVFDPAAITEADLSIVQLIESARQTALRDGKKVCISGPLPVSLRDVLVRGGYLNSPESALFWAAP